MDACTFIDYDQLHGIFCVTVFIKLYRYIYKSNVDGTLLHHSDSTVEWFVENRIEKITTDWIAKLHNHTTTSFPSKPSSIVKLIEKRLYWYIFIYTFLYLFEMSSGCFFLSLPPSLVKCCGVTRKKNIDCFMGCIRSYVCMHACIMLNFIS